MAPLEIIHAECLGLCMARAVAFVCPNPARHLLATSIHRNCRILRSEVMILTLCYGNFVKSAEVLTA